MFITKFDTWVGASNHEFTAKKMLAECILRSNACSDTNETVPTIVKNKFRDLVQLTRYSVAVAFWNEYLGNDTMYKAQMNEVELDEPMFKGD